jgi:hypothetical protein
LPEQIGTLWDFLVHCSAMAGAQLALDCLVVVVVLGVGIHDGQQEPKNDAPPVRRARQGDEGGAVGSSVMRAAD